MERSESQAVGPSKVVHEYVSATLEYPALMSCA